MPAEGSSMAARVHVPHVHSKPWRHAFLQGGQSMGAGAGGVVAGDVEGSSAATEVQVPHVQS
jgi:hypothetical protein